MNSRKGCAGHVAGWAVFIARISRSAIRFNMCSIDDLNKIRHSVCIPIHTKREPGTVKPPPGVGLCVALPLTTLGDYPISARDLPGKSGR